VILEANFRPHSDYERAKLVALSDRIVEVYCWCPPEIATTRYEARAKESTHHPAHVSPTLDPQLLAEFDRPMRLGALIRVDTTLFVNIEALAQEIAAGFAVSRL